MTYMAAIVIIVFFYLYQTKRMPFDPIVLTAASHWDSLETFHRVVTWLDELAKPLNAEILVMYDYDSGSIGEACIVTKVNQ